MGQSANIVASGIEPRQKSIDVHVAIIAGLLGDISRDVINRLQQAEHEAVDRLNAYVPTERLLTLEEAAAYLRMSKRTLDDGTRPGREPIMPFLIQGGKKKFRKSSLDAELDRLEQKPKEVKL